ncbi:MAG TPA: hypothetical protein VMU22_03550 [Rhizomicrobium sp.]|nr:hypothetical protein [Rhizomicrobium sp.]
MLKYWRELLVLAAFAIGGLAGSLRRRNKRDQREAAKLNTRDNGNNSEDGKRNSPRRWPALVNIICRYPTYYRQVPAPQDDPLARKLARWTKVTGIGTCIAAFLAGVAAWVFWGQLRAMQAQLTEQREEQRPWVAAEITPTDSIIDVQNLPKIINAKMRNDDGGRVNFKILLTNVGHSPAFHVTVWMEGFVFGDPKQNAEGAQKALCERVGALTIDPRNKGNAILPGQTLEWKQMGVSSYAGWSKSDAQKFGVNIFGHHRIMMFAYGCIDYLFGSPFTHHQTGFLYMLDSDSFTQGEKTNSIPSDAPLDGKDLHAYPFVTSNLRTD